MRLNNVQRRPTEGSDTGSGWPDGLLFLALSSMAILAVAVQAAEELPAPRPALAEITIGPGLLDYGDHGPVFLPAGCVFIGPGMDSLRLLNQDGTRAADGCAFQPLGDVEISGLWLDNDHEQTAGLSGEQVAFGWGGPAAPTGATARITDCRISGHEFAGLYCWSGYRNRMIGLRLEIICGRWPIWNGLSGHSRRAGCYIELSDSHVTIDAARSTRQGLVGPRIVAVGARGGHTVVRDTTFTIIGGDGISITCLKIDKTGRDDTLIEAEDVRFAIQLNGTDPADVKIVDEQNGEIRTKGVTWAFVEEVPDKPGKSESFFKAWKARQKIQAVPDKVKQEPK